MMTFDEEPVRFNQTEMQVPAEQVRKDDRFFHRSQGWVTVVSTSTGHKNVTFTYVRDRDGVTSSTYAPIGFLSPIVRQDQTPEWTLWNLETELGAMIAEGTSKDAAKARADEITQRIKSATQVRERTRVVDITRRLLDVVELEVDERLWLRLGKLLEKDPARISLATLVPYWITGDPATAIMHLVQEITDEVLMEAGQEYRRDDATLAEQRTYGQVARGHGRPLMYGRPIGMAREIVGLREKLRV